jgi:hypothetical protein
MRRTGLAAAALCALTCAVLAVTRAATLTPDDLLYARSAVSGIGVFHPHHLLWTPLVRALWSGLHALGFAADATVASQIAGVIAAGVTVAAVYVVAERMLGSSIAACGAALALLVARGFWLFSTQAPSYLPSIAGLALLAVALVRRDGPGLARRVVAPALALVAAILFHQSTVVIVIPLVVFLLASEGRRGLASALAIVLPAAAIVLAAYAAAYAWTDARQIVTELRGTRPSGLGGFVQFVQAYRYHPYPFWGTWANLAPAGLARAVRSQVWNLVGYPAGMIAPLSRGAFAVAGAALAALLLADSLRRLGDPVARPARLFLLAWLLTVWTYVTWVAPAAIEYYLAPLVPLILLAAMSLDRVWRSLGSAGRSRLAFAFAALAAAVATLNLAAVWPEHRSKGVFHEEARRIARVVPAEWVVGDTYPIDQHLASDFDRSRVIAVPIVQLYYYDGGSPPAALAVPETTCFVVPVSLVIPDCAESGFDGYARPAEWLRFMGWVLDMRPDPDRHSVSGRMFRIIEPVDAPALLLVLPVRRPMPAMAALMLELDGMLPATVAGAPGPFMRWWERAGVRVHDERRST